MNVKDIKMMAHIASTHSGYNDKAKRTFHRLAKQYLEEIAHDLGLRDGQYSIRSNKAGVACLGEVILHSDNLYVHLGGSIPRPEFYYRCVKGRKDYRGGRNTHMEYEKLTDINAVVRVFQNHIERNRFEWAS
jgi:hypothetical protein